jgi:hypothetical protein
MISDQITALPLGARRLRTLELEACSDMAALIHIGESFMEPAGAYETRRILARKATAAAWLNEVVCKARMWPPAPPRVKFPGGGGDTRALVGQGRASRRWPTDTAQFA